MTANRYGTPNGKVELEFTGPTTTNSDTDDVGVNVVARDTTSGELLFSIQMTSREFLRAIAGMSTSYDAVIGSQLNRVGMTLETHMFKVPDEVTKSLAYDDKDGMFAAIDKWWKSFYVVASLWTEYDIRLNTSYGHKVLARRWVAAS